MNVIEAQLKDGSTLFIDATGYAPDDVARVMADGIKPGSSLFGPGAGGERFVIVPAGSILYLRYRENVDLPGVADEDAQVSRETRGWLGGWGG